MGVDGYCIFKWEIKSSNIVKRPAAGITKCSPEGNLQSEDGRHKAGDTGEDGGIDE